MGGIEEGNMMRCGVVGLLVCAFGLLSASAQAFEIDGTNETG
jgi:hypothetical protein